MTIQTFAPATTSDNPLDRHDLAAGRADAYDDHRDGTSIDTLRTRLDWLIDGHPSTGYVIGYSALVAELTAAAQSDRDTQTDLAYLDEAAL